MKKLEFSQKSWHSRLYMSTYCKGYRYLPGNICSYFWKLLFAIVMFVPAWSSHLVNKFTEKNEIPWYAGIILNGAFLFCGAGYMDVTNSTGYNLLQVYGIGILTFISFMVALFLGCCIIIFGIIEPITNRKKSYKPKKDNPLLEGWKAFKGKYCTPINWK